MPDCSEVANLMGELAHNLAARGKANSIDAVHKALLEDFPDLTPQELHEHLADYAASRQKPPNPAAKKSGAWQRIKNEALRPGKLKAQAEQMKADLAEGNLESYKPTPRERAVSSDVERLLFERDEARAAIRRRLESMKPKSFTEKAVNIAGLFSIARLGGDVGAIGRQGGVALKSHPVMAAALINKVKRAAFSAQEAHKLELELANDPRAHLWKRDGLAISRGDYEAHLNEREEFAMSNLADRIPFMRNTERAQRLYLNHLRTSLYDAMTASHPGGVPTKAEGEAIARFINDMTGRASGGSLDKLVTGLSTVTLSPRYYWSRIRFLAGAAYFQAPKGSRARKVIAAELARYHMANTAITAALSLGAAWFNKDEKEKKPYVELDPRSPKFGSVRFGKQWIGPGEGLREFVVLGAKNFTGQKKTKGGIRDLKGPGVIFKNRKEPGFGKPTIGDENLRFARQRAPVYGSVGADIITQKDSMGRPVTPQSVIESGLPIFTHETVEGYRELGVPQGTINAILNYTGIAKSYAENDKEDYSKPKLIFPDVQKALTGAK